jgi:hypothetical protein
MTDEAVRFMNSEVLSLNELSMAGGTSKFHFPFQLTQVFPVGEGHILIDHIPLEILDLVTSLLKATRIADLGMRFARSFSGDKIG